MIIFVIMGLSSSVGDCTWSLMCARQVIYYWTTPSVLSIFYFETESHWIGWATLGLVTLWSMELQVYADLSVQINIRSIWGWYTGRKYVRSGFNMKYQKRKKYIFIFVYAKRNFGRAHETLTTVVLCVCPWGWIGTEWTGPMVEGHSLFKKNKSVWPYC